jgi:hypothetical protein
MAIRSKAEEQVLKDSVELLDRVQKFPVETLAREEDLGKQMNFKEVVEPARRLVELYNRLSTTALEDLPLNLLQGVVQPHATATLGIFEKIISFQHSQGEGARTQFIQEVVDNYTNVFSALHPFISYSLHRSADFQRLDADARAALASIQTASATLTKDLTKNLDEAKRIVEEVRKVAAETGVSQQAHYFKAEADLHMEESETWRERTVKFAWVLGGWAVVSLFLTKIPWLRPSDGFQNFQLTVSKALVFAVISFMLYLSAKNFLAHRHNAIVNRHRQNALLTYKAFVEATGNAEQATVILTHASACVFSPQSTGYSQEAGMDAAKATSVVEVLGRQISGSKG